MTSDQLRGKTLRFSYPKESVPWHYRDEKGQWTGLMHRFFEDLALRGQFQIEYVEPNAYSYSMKSAPESSEKSYQVDNDWD